MGDVIWDDEKPSGVVWDEDPNAGVVSDLPGGGWNQKRANWTDDQGWTAEQRQLLGEDPVYQGMEPSPQSKKIAGGIVGLGAGAGVTALAGLGTVASGLGSAFGMGEGALRGYKRGSATGKSIDPALEVPGGIIGGLGGAGLGYSLAKIPGALLSAMSKFSAPIAEGAAISARLPAAIATAKAAAAAEAETAATIPAVSDAAAGVRNAWRIGSSTTQPLSEALASAKNPLLALRQLSLTMPREVVENEAKAAFGADAIRLLSLIY